MGIVISHKLTLNKINVKNALNQAESFVSDIKNNSLINIPIETRRLSDYCLLIDVEGCETLGFNFKSKDDILKEKAEDGYCYLYETLTDGGRKEINNGYEIQNYPENELYFCSDFCKTQFANSILAHKIIADTIKRVAMFCRVAEVDDEGDYYHSGDLGNASNAIESLGKTIDGLANSFAVNGFEVLRGGETSIKNTKKK